MKDRLARAKEHNAPSSGQTLAGLTKDEGAPFLLVEAKLGNTEPAKALRFFQEQLGIPAVQLTGGGDSYRLSGNGERQILVVPAAAWLSHLP